MKRDAEEIRLLTRLCEDPASVGKLLEPDLQALVCRCAVRNNVCGERVAKLPIGSPSYLVAGEAWDAALGNLDAAVALYRKWGK